MLTKDLSVTFCGVKFPNPFCLSSSPVGNYYEMCARAYDTGWGDMVFKTIGFSIANGVSPRFDHLVKEDTGFIGFKNMEQVAEHPLEENLAALRRLKEDCPDKVLIASIMGENEQQWEGLARLVQEAGADMIKCNFSCPRMTSRTMGNDIGRSPELAEKYYRTIRRGSTPPILTKMTPNIGNMCEVALAAERGGADGIATINTAKSVANIDLNQKIGIPVVNGKSSISGYSNKAVKSIALRFIQRMRTHPELRDFPIDGTGGIKAWGNAVELLLLGAATLQVTAGIMRYGYRIVEDIASGLSHYLADQGFDSLQEMVGLTNHDIIPTEDLDRNYIVYPHIDLDKYVGCGRCYISCYDDGHQTMGWNEKARTPHCNTEKYVGYLLCGHACPIDCIDLREVKFKKGKKEHPVALWSLSHFQHLVPVVGCGLNVLSGLQNHTSQYVVLIVSRIKRANVVPGIWFLSLDAV